MKEIEDKFKNINSIKDHYLVKAMETEHCYYSEFIEAAKILKQALSDKEFEYWCAEKMLIKNQSFAEKTFIQYAVETATSRFFAENYPAEFKTEVKINPNNNKDVDVQFIDNGFTFNVEVKCSDFVSKEKIEAQNGYKYTTAGRLPDRGQQGSIRKVGGFSF